MNAANRPPIEVSETEWRLIQQVIHEHIPHCTVWAFGSRAKGRAKKYSDLDLCVLDHQPLGLELTSKLMEAFAESDLPYKVDLVDWATLSEAFKKSIEQDKVIVHNAGS